METFVVPSRSEAEAVLDGLRKIIEQYEYTTLADYKALLDARYTAGDNNVGWTDLRKATVEEVVGGWTVNLPEPTKVMS